MWKEVDLDKGVISIRHQVQYDQEKKTLEFTAPKYDSFRTISVDSVLLELLKDEYNQQKKAQDYYGERYHQVCVDENGYLDPCGKTWKYAHNTDALREQTNRILSTIYK